MAAHDQTRIELSATIYSLKHLNCISTLTSVVSIGTVAAQVSALCLALALVHAEQLSVLDAVLLAKSGGLVLTVTASVRNGWSVGSVAVAVMLGDSGLTLNHTRASVEAMVFTTLGTRHLTLQSVESRGARAVLVVLIVSPRHGIRLSESAKSKLALSSVLAVEVTIWNRPLGEFTVRTIVVTSAGTRGCSRIFKVLVAVTPVDAKYILGVIAWLSGRDFAILANVFDAVVVHRIAAVTELLFIAELVFQSRNALSVVVAIVVSIVACLVFPGTAQTSESLWTSAMLPHPGVVLVEVQRKSIW